jgi:hypothetical protein
MRPVERIPLFSWKTSTGTRLVPDLNKEYQPSSSSQSQGSEGIPRQVETPGAQDEGASASSSAGISKVTGWGAFILIKPTVWRRGKLTNIFRTERGLQKNLLIPGYAGCIPDSQIQTCIENFLREMYKNNNLSQMRVFHDDLLKNRGYSLLYAQFRKGLEEGKYRN